MDIVDALARFQSSFRGNNLKTPTIVLESHEEGIKFLMLLRQTDYWVITDNSLVGTPVEMPDGSLWMQIDVINILVRWPAMWFS